MKRIRYITLITGARNPERKRQNETIPTASFVRKFGTQDTLVQPLGVNEKVLFSGNRRRDW
jgi:hypothetical protein